MLDSVKPWLMDTVKSTKFGPRAGEDDTSRSNLILKKNEKLSKIMENVKDEHVLALSALKERVDEIPINQDSVVLGREKQKIGRFGDYEALLPSDYYTFLAKKNVTMDNNKWFLRSHHIESLTGK